MSAGSKRVREGGQSSEVSSGARPVKRARAAKCEPGKGLTDDTESDSNGEDLFGSFEKTVCISCYINTSLLMP